MLITTRPSLFRVLGVAPLLLALATSLPAAAAEPPAASPIEVVAARTDPAEKVVAAAIKAALANDFNAWLETLHPNERKTPEQKSQLERYTFKRVAKQARWYVRAGDPESFEIARREDMGAGRVKLFLKDLEHPNRAPVPVALETLPGGAYAIIAISL
ncbi:MAG: hypothetical protein IT385_29810 [Deltaproteobacteria bacterium]|nr:hypothetical protein [Deltaproteobacteria bacterium]